MHQLIINSTSKQTYKSSWAWTPPLPPSCYWARRVSSSPIPCDLNLIFCVQNSFLLWNIPWTVPLLSVGHFLQLVQISPLYQWRGRAPSQAHVFSLHCLLNPLPLGSHPCWATNYSPSFYQGQCLANAMSPGQTVLDFCSVTLPAPSCFLKHSPWFVQPSLGIPPLSVDGYCSHTSFSSSSTPTLKAGVSQNLPWATLPSPSTFSLQLHGVNPIYMLCPQNLISLALFPDPEIYTCKRNTLLTMPIGYFRSTSALMYSKPRMCPLPPQNLFLLLDCLSQQHSADQDKNWGIILDTSFLRPTPNHVPKPAAPKSQLLETCLSGYQSLT